MEKQEMIVQEQTGIDTEGSSAASQDIEQGNRNGASRSRAPMSKPTSTKGAAFANPAVFATPGGDHKKKTIRDETGSASSSLEYQSSSSRETKSISFLRFAVVAIWLAAACVVSFGVYSFTREAEFKEFEIQYGVDAEKILDRFYATIDKRLVATNSLAAALTMHARATNQTFPYVTMPDYIVPGSDARILADAAIIHWLPLITDENRGEWEKYAYEHRQQVDEEFEKDEDYRRQEDIRAGLVDAGERQLQQENETAVEFSNSSWLVNNVVQDGSNFHYRIFSPETKQEVPEGKGPFLPIWQRTPVNEARQASLNIDMGRARGLLGIFPYWSDNTPKGALLHRAIIPHPNVAPLHDKVLASSQYRHQSGPYQGTPTTKLAYPVFNGFGQEGDFVGVLSTTMYWRLSFEDIFQHRAQGMICVIENTFGQVFSYRIDGPDTTYLGEGDPLVNNTGFIFEDMVATHTTLGQYTRRPVEERRSPTTLALDEEFGEYRLKIYPTQDTYSVYKGNEPMIYTGVVAAIFVLAAIVFLLYDFYVQRRHKIMMAKGIEQAQRAAAAEREAAIAERELNEYLAHEVRNPLSAAISACSFISCAVAGETPLSDEPSRLQVRDDLHIVSSSLQFINDLLRNMLDLHRAVNHQVAVQKKATDLYHDVLEPVASMLYCRDDNFEVSTDCPRNLIVQTDSLRLRQIVLNLGRNAAKFVQKGFVCLRAEVVQGVDDEDGRPTTSVRIYVEDSGPGIPAEKRRALFAKFQQSLDLLSQGTGVGLCLCKQLADAMGGSLWLDESYDSGQAGSPGSRFVIDLKTAPSESVEVEDEECPGISEKAATIGIVKSIGGSGEASLIVDDARVPLDSESTPSVPKHMGPSLVDSEAGIQNGNIRELNKDRREVSRGERRDKDTLPENLSILFVDDDMVLRKLFSRSLKRLEPGWRVQEASSGETAIRLVDSENFDLIFMDQYMASTEKQLLGTEATRELRAKGVKSKICGLSANDKREAFLDAGADGFMLKPVPIKKDELMTSLLKLLQD